VAHDPKDAPIAEDKQIDSLEDRIAAARKAEDERLARDHGPMQSAQGMGIQVISTMVGYPLGGILIGLVLDNLFDTLHWITIGLMFLAFAGACMHVVRMNKNRAE
jgi:F0F1-type ATP synthase assembly protein I